MTRVHTFRRALAAASLLWASTGLAFDPPAGTFSSGEVSPVMSCFYECKQVQKAVFEDTLLMLVNESPVEFLGAEVLLLDGREQPVVRFRTQLSPLDLDEINICRTFERAGFVPPQAGVIEIVSVDAADLPEGGIYAWIKDINGNKRIDTPIIPPLPATSITRLIASDLFFDVPILQPIPVNPKIRKGILGIGKTECRVTPPEVYNGPLGIAQIRSLPARLVYPVYEEETDDPTMQPTGVCDITRVLCRSALDPFAVNCEPPDTICAAP